MRIRVKVIVPHDHMGRFEEYVLEDTVDLQRRIERGFVEFVGYVDDDDIEGVPV